MRQIPVVRKDERSRRVCVETADRHDARVGRDQLHHGATTMGITRRRHDSGGLVQEHVCKALALYLLAVDLHDVAPTDHRVQLAAHAVDAHTSRADELVRACAVTRRRRARGRRSSRIGSILARVLRP